jgi:hypothetical protein
VKKSPIHAYTPNAATAPEPGPVASWNRFWFTAVDPIGLHTLRVLSGLLFLVWIVAFVGHQEAFFGLQGWFDEQAYREASRLPDGIPMPLGWSIFYLCRLSPALMQPLYWGSVAAIALFALGVAPRLTGVLTWVAVVSFTANPAIGYDVDFLLVLPAFYLMIGYLLLGQWNGNLSWTERILGPWNAGVFAWRRSGDERPSSYAANVAVRLLQVNFALAVVVGAFHKLQFGDWWSGVAFWYPLHPPFETTLTALKAKAAHAPTYLATLSFAQYVVLAWQFTFPLFAWRTGWWRLVLIGGALVGWLGTALMWQLPMFGPVYLLCCLNYLRPSEWRAVGATVAWLPTLFGLSNRPAAVVARPAEVGVKV